MPSSRRSHSVAVAWRRPHSWIYNNNYNFGLKYYEDTLGYADKRKMGAVDNGPVPKLPTIEESAFRDLKARTGWKEDAGARQRAEESSQSFRLNLLKKEHERLEKKTQVREEARQLRRSQSFGSFTAKSTSEIESDLRTESSITGHNETISRHRRVQTLNKLDYDHEKHVQHHEERKRALEVEARDVVEKLISAGLRQQETSMHSTILAECQESRDASWMERRREFMSSMDAEIKRMLSPVPALESVSVDTERKQVEIQQLTARLVEAETTLKSEIHSIRQKFQSQITDLERSLDQSTKSNNELQKTMKSQSKQLLEMQSVVDELRKQLYVTNEQYAVVERKHQATQAELEQTRVNLEAMSRLKRQAELRHEEVNAKLNELSGVNISINSVKLKLEEELSSLRTEYDRARNDVRQSEDRFNRALIDLKQVSDSWNVEKERVLKIDASKKLVEGEVKALQIRLKEAQNEADAGGKKSSQRLETRIRDLEIECNEEKSRHQETLQSLYKRERQLREVSLGRDDDQKTIALLTEQVDNLNKKVSAYRKQVSEQETASHQSLVRVREAQRQLDSSTERASSSSNVSKATSTTSTTRTRVTAVPVQTTQVVVVERSRRRVT